MNVDRRDPLTLPATNSSSNESYNTFDILELRIITMRFFRLYVFLSVLATNPGYAQSPDLIAGMKVSSGWVEPKGRGMGIIQGAVTNRNAVAVRSVSVHCAGYLNSGQSIGRDFMIWESIEPGASALFSVDIKGFDDSAIAKCRVLDLRTLTEVR